MTVASLEIAGPGTLIVHEWSLLAVTARDAQGQVVTPMPAVTFRSSDAGVVTVSSGGVISAVGRGTATISVTRDTLTARLTVVVKARLEVVAAEGWEWADHVAPSIGDSLQLRTEFVDIDGVPLGAAPVTAWESSNPAVVSVDSTGLVIALQAEEFAIITASTPDGQATKYVSVQSAGPPVTVRLAHAALGVGPITFRTHGLPAVTLQYGQSIDMVMTSHDIYVEADGLPTAQVGGNAFFGSFISGATLALYAFQGPSFSGLAPAWSTSDPIPADSGFVRLVQSSTVPVVYLRATGTPRSGLPEQCYFDPGNVTPYYSRLGGAFDLILQGKPGYYFDSNAASTRLAATAVAGHAVTLVLTGNSLETVGYLTFTDR